MAADMPVDRLSLAPGAEGPAVQGRVSLARLAVQVDQVPPQELPDWIRRLERDTRQGARRLLQRARRRWEQWQQQRRRWQRLTAVERWLHRRGMPLIAGVDEVGRGCLAGPVVAAAVILPATAWIPGLDDSKRLSPGQRERLAEEIRRQAVGWAVGLATPTEINALNIAQATRLAMRRALDALPVTPSLVLVDGREVANLGVPQRAVVDGDARCSCIAAASVLAKVWRDRLMALLDRAYPLYGFAIHKGYGTSAHREALRRWGVSPEHRRAFAPVQAALGRGAESGAADRAVGPGHEHEGMGRRVSARVGGSG